MTTSILDQFAHLLDIPRLVRPRRVVTRSGARVRGIFPSRRFGKEMHWEASLERRLLYRLEASLRVCDACTQPLTVSIPSFDGGPFRVHAGCDRLRSVGNAGLCRVQALGRAAESETASASGSHRPTPEVRGHSIHRRDRRQPQRPRCRAELLAARHCPFRQGHRHDTAADARRHRGAAAHVLRAIANMGRNAWSALCARTRSALFRYSSAVGRRRPVDVGTRGEL